nr:F0F1 ATP synthase subunit B [uncultured Aminipila sp.]
MEGNLFTIFATIVNFIVLILILKWLLFDKVNNAIESRNNEIIETINSAETKNLEADKLMKSCEKQIAELESEGREIIKHAKIKAETQASEIIDHANAKAIEIKLHAEKEIERQRTRALAEMKSQVAAMALLAAEKILEKDLELEGQEHLIDNIIEQVGAAKWQN